MRELLHKISSDGCSMLGAVLHLGAGTCKEVDEYLRFKPEKMMLVEANPEIADRLQSRIGAIAGTELLASAVAAQEGEVVLRVLNDPRNTSLLRPATLLAYCPNLSETHQLAVPAVTLSQLLLRLAPDVSVDNLLLLELQGAEFSVLSSASAAELQNFSWIAVRASLKALYEGGARLEEVDALLQRSGFRTVPHAQDEAAWPFRNALYRRDTRLVRLQTLDNLLREREQSLEALRNTLEEGARRIAALESDKTSLELSAAQQRGESEKLRRALEQERLEKNELVSRRELDEACQAAAQSAKLQALREADLRDLQERYRRSLSIQEQQRNLLVTLAERLTAASSHFRPLAGDKAALSPGKGEKQGPTGATGGEQMRRQRSGRRSAQVRRRKS